MSMTIDIFSMVENYVYAKFVQRQDLEKLTHMILASSG